MQRRRLTCETESHTACDGCLSCTTQRTMQRARQTTHSVRVAGEERPADCRGRRDVCVHHRGWRAVPARSLPPPRPNHTARAMRALRACGHGSLVLLHAARCKAGGSLDRWQVHMGRRAVGAARARRHSLAFGAARGGAPRPAAQCKHVAVHIRHAIVPVCLGDVLRPSAQRFDGQGRGHCMWRIPHWCHLVQRRGAQTPQWA